MILEGIVTTRNADGSVNISPMGPLVDEAMRRIELRPFRTSTTYANLRRIGAGVLHVTDDVLLFAQAAVGQPEPMPPATTVGELLSADEFDGLTDAVREAVVLSETCRWYAFRVVETDDRALRASLVAEVVCCGRIRDFFGFNRGKHAVLELAILATRVGILPADEIDAPWAMLRRWIEKTGGPREHAALEFLESWLAAKRKEPPHG